MGRLQMYEEGKSRIKWRIILQIGGQRIFIEIFRLYVRFCQSFERNKIHMIVIDKSAVFVITTFI